MIKMHIINPKNLPDSEDIKKFFYNIENVENHHKIIEMFLEAIKDIKEIEAVFLGGSLAFNNGDVFSDIDLYLMISDFKNLNEVKNNIIDKINYLTYIIHMFSSMANRNDLIIYLRPFIKLDLSFKNFDKISKSWKIGSASKIILDRNGLGNRALQLAKTITFDLKNYEFEISNFAIAFPSLCYNLAGYMIRGEYITSMDFFAWMRRNLMRISGFLLGMWDEGTRKAEIRFPQKIINYYHQIQIDDINKIWNNFKIVLEWYRDFIIPKLNQHNIPHSGEELDTINIMLKELKLKL